MAKEKRPHKGDGKKPVLAEAKDFASGLRLAAMSVVLALIYHSTASGMAELAASGLRIALVTAVALDVCVLLWFFGILVTFLYTEHEFTKPGEGGSADQLPPRRLLPLDILCLTFPIYLSVICNDALADERTGAGRYPWLMIVNMGAFFVVFVTLAYRVGIIPLAQREPYRKLWRYHAIGIFMVIVTTTAIMIWKKSALQIGLAFAVLGLLVLSVYFFVVKGFLNRYEVRVVRRDTGDVR